MEGTAAERPAPLGPITTPSVSRAAVPSRQVNQPSAFNPNTLYISIPLIVVGLLGALSSYLPYFNYEGETYSGWQSAEFTRFYDLFSAGPSAVLIVSLLVAIGGLSLTVGPFLWGAPTQGRRISMGVVIIIWGIALLVIASLIFSALDEAAQNDEIFINVDNGWYLIIVVGFATIGLGIVTAAAAKPFEVRTQVESG